MTVIRFYRAGDAHGAFSNFSRHPVSLQGKVWPTTEHYFQAQKFAGTDHEEVIRNAPGPGEAARMGRQRSRPLRPDWEQVKDDIMREVVLAKFTQHEDLRRALLDTGDAELVEHTKNDAYWADGGDGSGRNMLGKILMEIREQLRRSA
ncbi:NADAR family protein [Sorangium sp. So ce590]|uniref:NADAR family protein n=1 Tax=unclassified Sorangium TaxID=2621164 RepID=UPI003F61D318